MIFDTKTRDVMSAVSHAVVVIAELDFSTSLGLLCTTE